jgi:protein-L-isoaspartate O-methyltransferase
VPESNDSPPRAFRAVFEQAGYSEEGLCNAIGQPNLEAVLGSTAQVLLGRTAGADRVRTLARLFFVGIDIDSCEAEQALGPIPLERWEAAGFIEPRAGRVVPRLKLVPYQGLLLASDATLSVADGIRADFVAAPSLSALMLANLTIRQPCRRALDVGTGGGILAFLAARHSQRVTAVDCNEHALTYARFNAALNDLPQVDLIKADFFAPLRKGTFDLIVSNPPFVISPRRTFTFRDGGRQADELCRDLVRHSAEYLDEGGFSQILCNWAHVAGERWQDRVASWCEGTGCDAFVLQGETVDPGTYAATWVMPSPSEGTAALRSELEEWLRYFEQHRIEAIGTGMIVLRRTRAARGWVHVQDSPDRITGPSGDSVLRAFGAQDFLRTMGSDVSFVESVLRIAPEVRLEQVAQSTGEHWIAQQTRIRLMEGLAYEAEIDPTLFTLLGRCDGRRTVGELVGGNGEATAGRLLSALRLLVERGFLLPLRPS